MSIIGVQQISRWSLYTILSIPLFFVHIFSLYFLFGWRNYAWKIWYEPEKKDTHTENSRRCSFLLGDKWNKFAVKKALIEKPSTHQCSTSTNATLPLGHTRIPMYNDSIKHGVLFFHRSTATVNTKKGRVDQRITFHQMVNRFRFVTVLIMYLRNVPIS